MRAAPSTATEDVLVDCRSVWKIFGNDVGAAVAAVREGRDKQQIFKSCDCIVAVSDVSLEVRRGEIFCIMGLSGSGKSTLIRLLNRLAEPTLGQVLVKGRDLATLKPEALRAMRAQHIGMVFQSVALLPNRTVLQNAAFGLEVQGIPRPQREKVAQGALDRVGLADWSARYPRELSGGMMQRVGLARALAADPEIILMDEPFSALDPLIRRQLQDEFRNLTKTLGKSAVFITHDLDEAIRIGDRIAIMKDGAIIQMDTAEGILMRPANDYVAQFVAGISPMHLITSKSVMCPVAEYAQRNPHVDVGALSRATPDADIDALLGLMLETQGDAVAVRQQDEVVGIVTLRGLLGGLRGAQPASRKPAETGP